MNATNPCARCYATIIISILTASRNCTAGDRSPETPAVTVIAVVSPSGQPCSQAKAYCGRYENAVMGLDLSDDADDPVLVISPESRAEKHQEAPLIFAANQNGLVSLPLDQTPWTILVTDRSGYAIFRSRARGAPSTIRLTPWIHVAVTMPPGDSVYQTGEPIYYQEGLPRGDSDGMLIVKGTVRAKKDGAFDVKAGIGNVRLEQIYYTALDDHYGMDSARWSRWFSIDQSAGKSIHLDASGALIQGQIAPRPGLTVQQIMSKGLTQATIKAETPAVDAPPTTEPFLVKVFGRLVKPNSFTTNVSKDGSFSFEHVPPGKYALSILRSLEDTEGRPSIVQNVASLDFTVPAGADRIDLGPVR